MKKDLEFYSFIKILILGSKGVGKETLINMMKNDVFENGAYSDDCID
jgi:GTPase SAR1 family protein